MGAPITLLVLLVLLAWFILDAAWDQSKRRRRLKGQHLHEGQLTGRTNADILFAILTGILVIVFVSVWINVAFKSLGRVQADVAWCSAQQQNFEWAVTATEGIQINVPGGGGQFLNPTYAQQSQVVSARIQELRDQVSAYNQDLAYLTKMNSIPILGSMYANWPTNLKYADIPGGCAVP